MFYCYLYLLRVILLSITFKTAHSASQELPKINSASIYETLDQHGPNVTFVDDMDRWSDFQKLLGISSNTVKKPTTICVHGAWLIYGKADFRTQTSNDVHVFSGNDNCVQPPNIYKIGSMQPIGPYKFQEQSITVFDKKFFGSFGVSYSPKGTEIKKIKKQWLPTLESLITIGTSSWTLVDFLGRRVCVQPKTDIVNPICLSPVMHKYTLPKDIRFVGVFANCGASNTSVLTLDLTDCKEFGSSKMEKVPADNAKLLGRAVESACKKSADNIPMKEDIVKKLTKLRFSHDFSAKEQLLWPERKEDIWKTELFDTAFDIMMSTCPEEVVPTGYLELIRELTVYHLDKAWKTFKKNSVNTKEVDKLAADLNYCLGEAMENSLVLQDQILQLYQRIPSPDAFSKAIYSDFTHNPKHDIVIDSAWIVANYALGLCHHLSNYQANFWAEFINVFRDLYFVPLTNRWQKPKEISAKAYGAILAGFGTEIQFQRMGFCASLVFDLTPNLAPFDKFVA